METRKKRLLENILSLSVLNGINMVIPLITLPYLIKTIGLGGYGGYSIVYSMIQYAILISSYGFAYSTTQQISQHREDTDFVNNTFNAVLVARTLLAIIVCVIMGVICFIFYPPTYVTMFIFGLGMVFGDILNPTWLYQGMEQMRFMTIINLISKTVFTLLIFVFIKSDNDIEYVTLLNSAGFIVAGVVSLIIANKLFKVKLKIPSKSDLIFQYKSGWYIFLSTISMTLYRNSNIIILGFFVSSTLVGIYSGAEKVIKAVQATVTPISNALFPYIAKSFKDSNEGQKVHSIIRISKYLGMLLLVITIGTYLLAPLANKILLDNADILATKMIKFMSPVIFFGGLNYIIGIVGLVNLGKQKQFFQAVSISGVISLAILFLLLPYIHAFSACISMVCTEIVLFVMCCYHLKNYIITDQSPL